MGKDGRFRAESLPSRWFVGEVDFADGHTGEPLTGIVRDPPETFRKNVGAGTTRQPGAAVSTKDLFKFFPHPARNDFAGIHTITCRGISIFGACLNIGQTNVGGSEAEWIMERPTVGGSLPDLADYSYSYMYDAYAEKTNGSWVTYNGANNQQIFMYNGNDLLSGVYPSGSTTMLFYWFNWH